VVLLIRGKSKCSLCGQVLAPGEDVVGFSHFLGPDHRLWRYSDSAMHPACFDSWPDKEEFLTLYAEAQARSRGLGTPQTIEEMHRRQAVDREARSRRDAAHNEEHARIMAIVREHGAACPHCGSRSASYRELNGPERFRLACQACGRSCNATELQLDARGSQAER
jgi:transcription elongation factor Elf1